MKGKNDPGPSPESLRILFCCLDYDASATGIPKYSGEIGAWLAGRGHRVEVVASHPHYPTWRVDPAVAERGLHSEVVSGVTVWRVPIPLPRMGGIRPRHRIVMEVAFLLRSFRIWRRWSAEDAPDVVFAMCPSFLAALPALRFARARNVPLVLHVQDLQAEAARRLGMLRASPVLVVARRVERLVVRSAAQVVTIGERMAETVRSIRGKEGAVSVLPNWADVESIRPSDPRNPFRAEVGARDSDFVVMCAGSMGEKHGLEVVLEAAGILRGNVDIRFVFVGDGSRRAALVERATQMGLSSVFFAPLQPAGRLSDVLAAADLHLVVQRRGAADLVLPSKVGNILAAGRTLLATAEEGTGLYDLVVGNGVGAACPPEDPAALAEGIVRVNDAVAERAALGARARAYAEAHLAKDRVLAALEDLFFTCAISQVTAKPLKPTPLSG